MATSFKEISKTNVEKWLSWTADQLIELGNQCNGSNYNLAERTVEAVTPSLMKMGEGYLSEDGDIQVFLYIALEEKSGQVLASVVQNSDSNANSEEKIQPRLTVQNQQAKQLVAAFLCTFPNALFSIDGGIPLVMFMEIPGSSASLRSQNDVNLNLRGSGLIPGEKVKRFVTLNNMIEATQYGCHKICIAIPKAKDKDKDKK